MLSGSSSPSSPRCASIFPSSKPPAQPGRRVSRGGGHVENRALSDRGAHVVEVDAQHDDYGEEGEAEAEASDGAVQGEAEPVDEPAAKETRRSRRT